MDVLPAEPTPIRRNDSLSGDFDQRHPDLSDSLADEVERLGDSRAKRASDVAPRTPAASRRAPKATADDVGTLFEALRTTAEVDVLVGTIAPIRSRFTRASSCLPSTSVYAT